jgi:hypothetical protein
LRAWRLATKPRPDPDRGGIVRVLPSFPIARKSKAAFVGLLLLHSSSFPTALFGEATTKEVEKGENPLAADFLLTIQDNLLSLNAKEASLAQLLAEIGRRMNIEVMVESPAEDKITLTFDRLSLEEALQRFRNYTNLVYFESAPGQITKIVLFPRAATTGLRNPATTESDLTRQPGKGAPRQEPFKFEFDPSQHKPK